MFVARRSREILATGMLRASARMVELIDGPAGTAFDASKFTLGVGGVKPAADTQVSVSVDLKAGFVIRLRDDQADQAQVIEAHTVSTDSE